MPDVLCAWCPRYFPGEPVAVVNQSPVPDSHSICERCRERFEAGLEQWESRTPAQILSRATVARQVAENERG